MVNDYIQFLYSIIIVINNIHVYKYHIISKNVVQHYLISCQNLFIGEYVILVYLKGDLHALS